MLTLTLQMHAAWIGSGCWIMRGKSDAPASIALTAAEQSRPSSCQLRSRTRAELTSKGEGSLLRMSC